MPVLGTKYKLWYMYFVPNNGKLSFEIFLFTLVNDGVRFTQYRAGIPLGGGEIQVAGRKEWEISLVGKVVSM